MENRICKYCGKELDTDGKMCSKCREKRNKKSKEYRMYYLTNGICPYCRTEKLFGNEKSCPECRAKRENTVERYRAKNREKCNNQSNEYHKKYYRDRKEKGLCVRCGKHPSRDGKTLCNKCTIKRKEYEQEAQKKRGNIVPRYERVDNGLCYFCGDPIPEGRICKNCSEKVTKNLPEKRGGGMHWKNQNNLIFMKSIHSITK